MTEAGARKKNPTRREKALDSTEFLIDDEAQADSGLVSLSWLLVPAVSKE